MSDPKKDEIAAAAERKIGIVVAEWYDSGEFDLHARVRGIIKQALDDYGAVLHGAK